jgi:hypothetical protein
MAMSDAVWLAIIGVVAMAVKEYFDRQRAKDAAIKTDEVKDTLKTSTDKQSAKQDVILAQNEVVLAKVEEVHLATNSMKDDLVKKTEEEALARGGSEERARADAQRKGTT